MTNEENKVVEQPVETEQEVQEEQVQETEELSVEEKLNNEIADLKNSLLRSAAELENTRKRHQKEISDTNKYASAKFAKEMLSVQDNMQRALESLDKVETEDEALKKVLEGIKMVSSQLENSFIQAGIVKIESLGQKLNPEFHQAMAQVESEEESGTIIQVYQDGYKIHDRLLRPAMVVVSQ